MISYLLVAVVAWTGALLLHLHALRMVPATDGSPASAAEPPAEGACPLPAEAAAWLYLVLAYASVLAGHLDLRLPNG